MDASVMFLDCPAKLDEHGAVRCGLPAAVEYWYTCDSTDGPLESAKIRCPRGHGYNGPLESLTWGTATQPAGMSPAPEPPTRSGRPPGARSAGRPAVIGRSRPFVRHEECL